MLPQPGKVVKLQVDDLDIFLFYEGVDSVDLLFCHVGRFLWFISLCHVTTFTFASTRIGLKVSAK